MSSLAEVEAARRAEAAAARRWLARNEKKLPPEELPRERVLTPDGKRDTYLWAFFYPIGEDGGRYHPMTSRPYVFDLRSTARSARIDRALKALPVKQRNLLNDHYLLGKTFPQMARRETWQAVQQRTRTAVKAFMRKLLEQEHDIIVLREEDF